MNGDFLLWDFAEGLLINAPIYLTLAVGAGILLARWERHPAGSIWGVLGSGWLLMSYVVGTAWTQIFVPDLFPDVGTTLEQLSYVVLAIVRSIGYVFLIVAIVSCRRRPMPQFIDDHDDDH